MTAASFWLQVAKLRQEVVSLEGLSRSLFIELQELQKERNRAEESK